MGPDFRLADGAAVVSFASNDYLGLSTHAVVRAAAHDALERWGAGTGSSRLIVGDRPIHTALEDDIAAWRNSEAALVFPTGFQTNLAVLTTFGAGARIVSDELNHASIIDGARLAKAQVTVYRHGDVEEAAHLVAGAPGRALVITDTVFSMDGDVADVEGLSEMCARANALLVLDDAHAVFGEGAAAGGATACLRVGTLSKALGSQGGYVAGPRSWIDLLINRARSFIFTTGLAPASAAAARPLLAICRSTEGDARRATLRAHIHAVRPGHSTPIIPVMIGGERDALDAADSLLQCALLVPAIRPPTVPPAPAGYGCPCPPPTPRTMSPGSSKRSGSSHEATPGGRDHWYRHRGGQDLHRRSASPPAGRRGAVRCGPQARPVLRARRCPRERDPRPSDGRTRSCGVPRPPNLPASHGPAHGRGSARHAASHHRRSRRRDQRQLVGPSDRCRPRRGRWRGGISTGPRTATAPAWRSACLQTSWS